MHRRAIVTTLVFAVFLSFGVTLRAQAAAGHKLSSPQFCFGSVPIACAAPLKAKAVQTLNPATSIGASPQMDRPRWLQRDRWKVRLSVDYNFVQSNAVGRQGSGKALSTILKIMLPGNRLSNTLNFSRYNMEIPRLQYYCPNCGGFYGFENDDYDEFYDDLDYWCGYDDHWGFGASYYYYHPIYAQGSYNMSGFGVGIDRAPDEEQPYSLYGSLYYYPNISGSYTNQNTQITGGYQIWRFDTGLNYHPLLNNGLSFQLGLKGETWIGKGQSQNYRVIGGYAGSAFNW